MSVDQIKGSENGQGLRIGIVQARFNEEFGKESLEACLAELKKLGVAESDILVCSVPGALEVPLVLLQLGNESAAGVSRVSLELGIPVANAILTTYNEEQARQRTAEKGAEAARVAIEMVRLGESLDALHGDDGDDEE